MPTKQTDLPLDGRKRNKAWDPSMRIMEQSPRYLSDAELLEIVLQSHLPSDHAVSVARELIGLADGLHALADMSPEELMQTAGIGRRAACALIGALALGSRARSQPPKRGIRLTGPAEVARHFRAQFSGLKQEEFHVLLLDTKFRLIRDVLVTIGLVDRSQCHAREVFRQAIRESCSAVMLLHNHPSGDPNPSAPDLACTSALCEAGKIIGIEVIDHVILGTPSPSRPQGYISFREEKLLKAA